MNITFRTIYLVYDKIGLFKLFLNIDSFGHVLRFKLNCDNIRYL